MNRRRIKKAFRKLEEEKRLSTKEAVAVALAVRDWGKHFQRAALLVAESFHAWGAALGSLQVGGTKS